MVNSQEQRTQIKLKSGKDEATLSGVQIKFPGFRSLYLDSLEGAKDKENETILPPLEQGDSLKCSDVTIKEHETRPPARYTEASLVQVLEKEGVGRPSTYASILTAIQDRGYVIPSKNQLLPSLTALIVSRFLEKHFPKYVDLKFTSNMEEDLDQIAQGEQGRVQYLKSIYTPLKKSVDEKEDQIQGSDVRAIALPSYPKFVFKIGRYGAYVCTLDDSGKEVCGALPEGKTLDNFSEEFLKSLILQRDGVLLGKDPKTQEEVYRLSGRYGPYVQLGKALPDQSNIKDLKRSSISFLEDPDAVTLDQATTLLQMPLHLGKHPESGKDISKSVGRFGPYVMCDGDFRSIPKSMDFFEVTLDEALELLNKPKGTRFGSKLLRKLGDHPKKKKAINIYEGRYGPYLKIGTKNVSIPKGQDLEKLTLDQALPWVDEALSKKTRKRS